MVKKKRPSVENLQASYEAARPVMERWLDTTKELNAIFMSAWRSGDLDALWDEFRKDNKDIWLTYFIRARGMGDIKIGKSNQVAARVRNIWSGASRGVDLVACYPAPIDHEIELHREFEPYRLCGEWFRPGAEILTHLELIGCDTRAFTNVVPPHFYRRYPERLQMADVNTVRKNSGAQ